MFVAFSVVCHIGYTACTLSRIPESYPNEHSCRSALRERVAVISGHPAFDKAIGDGEIFAASCVYIADENSIKNNAKNIMRRILRKTPEQPA